jgi:hypothetical protein
VARVAAVLAAERVETWRNGAEKGRNPLQNAPMFHVKHFL